MSSAAIPALQCDHLGKRYGSEEVLEDISLRVQRGEVHALVGLNGAGKTTLMRIFVGMVAADSGSVRIGGRDPFIMQARNWAGVGHLVEAALAYPELTVLQNLELAGRLAGLDRAATTAAATDLCGELVLTRWTGTPARKLSAGNRQRLGLAAALIAQPWLLILDEPTNALDPAGVMILRKLLLRRTREEGMAVFVSSHHLDEAARVADQITVINGGRLVGSLDPAEMDLERQFFNIVYDDDEVRR